MYYMEKRIMEKITPKETKSTEQGATVDGETVDSTQEAPALLMKSELKNWP